MLVNSGPSEFGTRSIGLSPNPGHDALNVLFLTSFYCDVTITHPFDGPFNCDVTMEKSANRCDVGPLAIRQLVNSGPSEFGTK